MSEKTNISWATSTGNPWIGCTKVSPGCAHCYAAELDANRFSKTMGGGTKEKPVSHWGKGAPRFRTKAFWKDAVKWNNDAFKFPYACTKCGTRVQDPEQLGTPFACPNCNYVLSPYRPRIFPSLCDWLDDEVPIEWLADFLKLIHDTPNLDWLLLTKRPENWRTRLLDTRRHFTDLVRAYWHDDWYSGNPPQNVWIGISVEDQKRADERIPLLLQIPAKVRFLSVEPLLESINLRHLLGFKNADGAEISWCIVGGESGPHRRDCGVGAIADVAQQCVAAGVPCHVKQDCALKPGQKGRIPDDVWALKKYPTKI